jgi:hypothetical protein
MNTISIEAAADILDLQRGRIEQWISRGQFKPRATSSQGKKRDWDLGEVIRLAVFASAEFTKKLSLSAKPGTASIDPESEQISVKVYGLQPNSSFPSKHI